MNKKHCVGCRENFYNGNNGLGITECWLLKDAKVIPRKAVPLSQSPPWNQPAGRYPNCYSKPGYVMVRPEQAR